MEEVCGKMLRKWYKLKRLWGKEWGYGMKQRKILYKAIVESAWTYGAPFVDTRMVGTVRRRLEAAQRQVLMSMVGGYRTISLDALLVLVGVLPADLAVRRASSRYWVRRGRSFEIGGRTIDEDEIEMFGGEVIKGQVDHYILTEWQMRWDTSGKGRVVWEVIKDVGKRMKWKWFEVDHWSTQVLSGHGACREYLRRLEIRDSGLCRCGHPDTMEHKIFRCVLGDRERFLWRQRVDRLGWGWEENVGYWVYKDRWAGFMGLCKKMLVKLGM